MENVFLFLSKWGGKLRFFLETWGKRTLPNMMLRMTAFENLSNFGLTSMIWNNSLVIANRPFFYKHWAKAGAHNIKGLQANDDLTIITYREFRKKYCISLPLSLTFME